jgi:hypothetical protein
METAREVEERDPTFVNDLEASEPSREKAARWLMKAGHTVKVKPLQIRPDVEQRWEYSDDGDIRITDNGGNLKVEAKHRPDITFHSKQDFPFPTVIVNKRYLHDKGDTPFMYFIFSADLEGCFLVYVEPTREHWIETTRWNKKTKSQEDYYEVALKWVTYEDMKGI